MNKGEAENFVYQSYLETEKYQDYNAKDSAKRRPDLTREIICKRSCTPCVVVTGSKGKGSVSNMISQIMQSKYKVGLMTSPHMIDFCERFKINGKSISDKDFVKHMEFIQGEINEIKERLPKNLCISPIGIQTDLALSYFNSRQTDFNILECGKGVQYDDVNNAQHDYAVINSIFLEHTRELGETVEAIANDKSHVITGGQRCVYVAEQSKEVIDIIQKRARRFHVPIKVYGKDFWAENIRYCNKGMIFNVIISTEKYEDISIPLLGEHQAKNCALAMALCYDILGFLNADIVKCKLAKVNLPGRMEVLHSEPFIMLDACINSASCVNVINVLQHLRIDNATMIIGIPNDKDYIGVVRTMNRIASSIILTKSHNPHYKFTYEQCENMERENIHTTWADSIDVAISRAIEIGKPIVILGTTSVVSEVKLRQNLISETADEFRDRAGGL